MTTHTSAKIVADSVSPAGHRLTTFECVFPRIVLAEVNTHRMLCKEGVPEFSRNSASSRAIPVEKMIARVLEDPYVPTHWGKNQKGMSADEDLHPVRQKEAKDDWWSACISAVKWAQRELDIGVHKQITNRLIEPFMWHTAVITATEWSNFFNLRDNKNAHPDFRDLAAMAHLLYQKSEPRLINYGEWHLPYVEPAEAFDAEVLHDADYACRVSIGRCARVSYDRLHEEETPEKSKGRCDGMLSAGHMSPFEHVARPMTENELELFKQRKLRWDEEHQCWIWIGAQYRALVDRDEYRDIPAWQARREPYVPGEHTHFLGNFNGWVQYRKLIPYEEDILGARE